MRVNDAQGNPCFVIVVFKGEVNTQSIFVAEMAILRYFQMKVRPAFLNAVGHIRHSPEVTTPRHPVVRYFAFSLPALAVVVGDKQCRPGVRNVVEVCAECGDVRCFVLLQPWSNPGQRVQAAERDFVRFAEINDELQVAGVVDMDSLLAEIVERNTLAEP